MDPIIAETIGIWYINNYLNVEIMHGIIKEVILKEEIGYQIDEDDLNKAINAKTKAIILV